MPYLLGAVLLVLGATALIWFLTGRTGGAPSNRRPGGAQGLAAYPDDDEEYQRRCRERAEEQRRRAKGSDARRLGETPEDLG